MENKPTNLFSNKRFRIKLLVILIGILLFYAALYLNTKNGWLDGLLSKQISIETT